MSDTKQTRSAADQKFDAGDLDGAIAVALEEVRGKPSDTRARSRLIELLCFAGQWERAATQLEAAESLEPKAQSSISLLKQLIRADMYRQQFHTEGRAPEFLTPPPEHIKLRLAASIELRDGHAQAAADLLAKADALRKPAGGDESGKPFDDLRDLDDLLAGVFEVLTPTGKYFWVPIESVETMELSPPTSRVDLLWRKTQMIIREGGPDGVVYLPCLYAGSQNSTDAALRLGRSTDWSEAAAAPNPVVRGAGLRMFLVGDEERDVLALKSITFAGAIG